MSPSGYLLFMLLLAATNFGLGFGAAVLLGHGPKLPAVQLPWREWLQALAAWRPLRRRVVSDAQVESPSDEACDELPAMTLTPIHLSAVAPPPEVKPPAVPPAAVAADDALSLDAALARLQVEVTALRDDLGGLDERVRTCSAAPTVDGVAECVSDLKQTGQKLYQQQSQAIVAVQELRAEEAIWGTQHSSGQEIGQQQAEQLRQSLEQLDTWQVDPENLAEDCRQLLAATEQLMNSCDEVGQALESAANGRLDDFEQIETTTNLSESHGISHEPIHGVARAGRA